MKIEESKLNLLTESKMNLHESKMKLHEFHFASRNGNREDYRKVN